MSSWYKNESLFRNNTHCPICGIPMSKSRTKVELCGVGMFSNIFTCSLEHSKEFIRQVWKLSKQKDKRNNPRKLVSNYVQQGINSRKKENSKYVKELLSAKRKFLEKRKLKCQQFNKKLLTLM